ncbi:MAG TPA: hypothetical protein VKN18_20215 [Blastocatellia bacterium]|nr:hypothetical protein [Blastocatellia bacterium]
MRHSSVDSLSVRSGFRRQDSKKLLSKLWRVVVVLILALVCAFAALTSIEFISGSSDNCEITSRLETIGDTGVGFLRFCDEERLIYMKASIEVVQRNYPDHSDMPGSGDEIRKETVVKVRDVSVSHYPGGQTRYG